MNFRNPYLVGLIASGLLILLSSSVEQTAFAADSLKITGPDGEVRQPPQQTTRQYGPTRSSDTFWSIAQRTQPDSTVSIYQVMGAIYDANPHAFSNANYNSLEKGMILLIPSKELMLAIPKSLAKQRAERNDAGWRASTAKPAAKPSESKVKAGIVEKSAVSTPALTSAKNVKTSDIDNSQMLTELEASEDKNLRLTDELGRAQDELTVSGSDITLLTKKVDELNEEIAILQEQLQASRLKNQSLSADVEALKERITELELPAPQVKEEGIKWTALMSNPLTLILGTAIPAFIFLIALWLLLKRRRNEGAIEQNAVQDAPEPVAAVGKTETDVEDDLDNMAVHLDTEDDDSLDSLMSVDSSDLQPEVEMEVDAEPLDMASEMFVDPGEEKAPEEPEPDVEAEDEGQSLDDLWAEAMGEQGDGEEEDLDSLLDGIGGDEPPQVDAEPEEAVELDSLLTDMNEVDVVTETKSNQEVDEELDSLLEGIGEPADSSDKAEEQVDETDLDSLLAEFDLPADSSEAGSEDDPEESDLSEEIASETEASASDKADEQVDETDLDSLLAEFDLPADSSEAGSEDDSKESDLSEEIAAELEEDVSDKADEDDLDSLLAEFDLPADSSEAGSEDDREESDLSEEIAAELEEDVSDKVDEQVDEADLEALLEGFDEPVDGSEDDSDESDLSEEIAAELEEDVSDKIDEQVDKADLETLLEGFDEPVDGSEDDLDESDLSEEIAAELEEDVSDKIDDQVDEADLEALLEGFDEPVDGSEDDSDESDLSEEIAAELEEDVSDKIDDQVDEADLEALLEGFDEPVDGSEDDSDESDLSEEIAAEVEEDVSDKIDEQVDEADLEILLEGFDEPASKDEALDALLADLESAEQKSTTKPIKEEHFFGDLKANKHNSDNDLEWDGGEVDSVEDIEQLSSEDRSENLTDEDVDLDLSIVDEGKITVDEALAALDAQESVDATSKEVDEHDLTNFQKDNGFIDIDRLLNEADEEEVEIDQYKELDVDMGELDSLMGNASMVDVDDEENSVNAKLDLSRAYIEIDDNDSAIALLQEVKLDGNDKQKQEAEGLINSLT
jgi:pilus assembly protein FimV